MNHEIADAANFWATATAVMATAKMPAHLKLHQTFPSCDSRRSVCVWEAESVDALREYLEPVTRAYSTNEYYVAPNKEGAALPSIR